MRLFCRQLLAMLKKNFIIKKRNFWRLTIYEFLVPIFFGQILGTITKIALGWQQNDGKDQIVQISYTYFLGTAAGTFAYFFACSFILNEMVSDKENRMRETLRIMNLDRLAYTLSYFITQGLFACFTSCIMFVSFYMAFSTRWILSDFTIIEKTQRQYICLFMGLQLIGLNLVAFCMAMSTFFTDSKLATQLGLFILIVPPALSQYSMLATIADSLTAIQTWHPYYGEYWLQFGYLIPHFTFSNALLEFLVDHGKPKMVLQLIAPIDFKFGWFCNFATIFFYLALYMYLDAVIPNKYGISQSCCFCLKRKKKQKHSEPSHEKGWCCFKKGNNAINMVHKEGQIIEMSSQEKPSFASKQGKVMIDIKNLHKRFGKFTAVSDLNLTVRENELLALLGHNGAGKTTTINMVTGVLNPDKGDVIVNGHSITKSLQAVRKDLGLCQQHDVLYDRLTVRENLTLACELKDIPYKDIQAEIDEILKLTMLQRHEFKMVEELSGGMKRKLSLGMSIVGKPSVIILDEPSSGLDVDSRRQVWALIQKIKKGRAIIMSTQHIEEADELADDVCVMHSGQIVVHDTPSQIKHMYGVGYTLIVELLEKNLYKKEDFEDQIDSIVLDGCIEGVQRLGRNNDDLNDENNQAQGRIQYTIPFEESNTVHVLLQKLEGRFGTSCLFAVEISSLESAYIRIVEEFQQIQDDLTKTNLLANNSGEQQSFEALRLTTQKTSADFKQKILNKNNTGKIHNDIYGVDPLDTQGADRASIMGLKNRVITPISPDSSDKKNESADLDRKFKQKIEQYKNSQGKQTFCKKVWAIFARRFIVFYREPRQWVLLVAPMINILNIVMMTHGVEKLQIAIIPLDTITDAKEARSKESHNHIAPHELMEQALGMIFPFILNFGFGCCGGIYMYQTVAEWEKGTRTILSQSGVGSISYYTGLFLADLLLFIPPLICMVGLIFAADIRPFGEFIWEFITLIIGFGPSLISFTYLCSHAFHTSGQAVLCLVMLFLALGTIKPLCFITYLFFTKRIHNWVFMLHIAEFYCNPFYNFFVCNYSIFRKSQAPRYEYIKLFLDTPLTPVVGMQVMLLQAGVFMTLNLIIDWVRTNKFRFPDKRTPTIEQQQLGVREDVKISESVVKQSFIEKLSEPNLDLESSGMKRPFVLTAVDLDKTYASNKLHAVCGNSFGVKKGQVLGLLGPNGAGKSTTFSMLSMTEPRSKGNIQFFESDNIDKISLDKHGQSFGMCPQSNAIYDQLTTEECLQFMAQIKGLNAKDTKHNIDLIIEMMDLELFRKTLAGNLSGGNKRKLSCALTLLVCPRVEFLDEPSAGVDPISRRALFKMVRQLGDSGIILTTHRMDEAQQLCDKIAIMINGRFVVFGSPDYLMEKYGKGYMFSVMINPKQIEVNLAKQLIKDSLPSAKFIAQQQATSQNEDGPVMLHLKYTIMNIAGALTNEEVQLDQFAPIPLSELFRRLSSICTVDNGMVRFDLTRSTLEQVFVSFAHFQNKPESEKNNDEAGDSEPECGVEVAPAPEPQKLSNKMNQDVLLQGVPPVSFSMLEGTMNSPEQQAPRKIETGPLTGEVVFEQNAVQPTTSKRNQILTPIIPAQRKGVLPPIQLMQKNLISDEPEASDDYADITSKKLRPPLPYIKMQVDSEGGKLKRLPNASPEHKFSSAYQSNKSPVNSNSMFSGDKQYNSTPVASNLKSAEC